MALSAAPLFDVPLTLLLERYTERVQEGRDRTVPRVTKCQAQREVGSFSNVQFTGERDVSIFGVGEFPVHFQIVEQVGPTIGLAHISARTAEEGRRGGHGQPEIPIVGQKNLPIPYSIDASVVSPA